MNWDGKGLTFHHLSSWREIGMAMRIKIPVSWDSSRALPTSLNQLGVRSGKMPRRRYLLAGLPFIALRMPGR